MIAARERIARQTQSCANDDSLGKGESMVVPMKNVLGEAILVNPAAVRWCKDQNQTVVIYFDKDHQIEVPGPLVRVQRELNVSAY